MSWQDRFWTKVDKNGPIHPYKPELGPCWMWTACVNVDGYGQFNLERRSIGVHRISYTEFVGPIPPGHEVCHSCNNRACCNFTHLYTDTHRNNVKYRDACGRTNRPQGEKHGKALLSDEQVRQMREEYESGARQIVLARKYGVAKDLVWRIVHRKQWNHI